MTIDGYTVINGIVYAIVGVSAIVGAFNLTSRKRRAEDDQTAANLINNLRTTVELQGKTIETLRGQVTKLEATIAHFDSRNRLLEELFKGRDPQMQKFLESAPRLMEIAEQNHEFAKTTAEGLTNLERVLKEFVVSIEDVHNIPVSDGKISP